MRNQRASGNDNLIIRAGRKARQKSKLALVGHEEGHLPDAFRIKIRRRRRGVQYGFDAIFSRKSDCVVDGFDRHFHLHEDQAAFLQIIGSLVDFGGQEVCICTFDDQDRVFA